MASVFNSNQWENIQLKFATSYFWKMLSLLR